MHTIELDAYTEQALSRLAAIVGKEPDQIIKDVLSNYLEEQANTGQADAAYSRYLAGQEKALSLDEVDYLPHLGRTEEDKTGSLLPSLKGFRQGLPLQSISAGEFCRAMREGERY